MRPCSAATEAYTRIYKSNGLYVLGMQYFCCGHGLTEGSFRHLMQV